MFGFNSFKANPNVLEASLVRIHAKLIGVFIIVTAKINPKDHTINMNGYLFSRSKRR